MNDLNIKVGKIQIDRKMLFNGYSGIFLARHKFVIDNGMNIYGSYRGIYCGDVVEMLGLNSKNIIGGEHFQLNDEHFSIGGYSVEYKGVPDDILEGIALIIEKNLKDKGLEIKNRTFIFCSEINCNEYWRN